MTSLLLAALLQAAAAAPIGRAAAPAAAPPPPAAAATTVSVDEDAPTAEGLESLRQSYHDSCEVRLYGEYDDICSALAVQIRHYGAALAKAQRKARAR
ncbi:MAG: hypothetical protein INR64_07495 [Caulobacteraceae bacterium]|nr:hypothetical protein [Caulobacter sp.]